MRRRGKGIGAGRDRRSDARRKTSIKQRSRRSYTDRPVSAYGRYRTRRRHGTVASIVPSRRSVRRLSEDTSPDPRRSPGKVRSRDEMPGERRYRGDRMRRSKAGAGLQATRLQMLRPRRTASRKATTPGVCTSKKETRRAVIIANGYGGINNARNYRRHERCR